MLSAALSAGAGELQRLAESGEFPHNMCKWIWWNASSPTCWDGWRGYRLLPQLDRGLFAAFTAYSYRAYCNLFWNNGFGCKRCDPG